MTTGVPGDERKRYASRAAPGQAGPPGQELPSAGTGELIPEPRELVPGNRTPDTIAGWKAVADGLLSDPCCARLVSIGSATSFEVRGVRREVACFTSFYLYSLTRGIPHALRAQTWPRITRFDDRWRWLVTSVVPQFRRFDADTRLVNASLRRILDEARDFASTPCVLPCSPAGGPRRTRSAMKYFRSVTER